MQRGVGEHNAITARLAEELDLPYYDLADNMPYNPDFWIDGLHLTAAGAAEQARQYAAFLVGNGLLPVRQTASLRRYRVEKWVHQQT